MARPGNECIHQWQIAPNSGWDPDISLGGVLGHCAPVVAQNADPDHRLEVFATYPSIGSSQRVYHIWQTSRNNGWSDWELLGGYTVLDRGRTVWGDDHIGYR